MKDKKEKIEKFHEGVKKASRITTTLVRAAWVLLGLVLLAGVVIVSIKLGKAVTGDLTKIFG